MLRMLARLLRSATCAHAIARSRSYHLAIAELCAIAVFVAASGILIAAPAHGREGGPAGSAVAPLSARTESVRLVDDAEALIKEAGQSDPIDSEKIRTAISRLKHAAQLYPRNDSAYVDLGFCYGLLKEPATAVEMYRTAARINPSPANFKELADIFLRAGSPEEALMAANAGLSKNPHDAGLYNARGMALTNLERFDEAGRDFRKALEIDPTLEAAKVNLDALGDNYSGRATISKKRKSSTN